MRLDERIDALVADYPHVQRPDLTRKGLAFNALALVSSLILFVTFWGLRTDLSLFLGSKAFALKVLFALGWLVVAVRLLLVIGRPGASWSWRWWLLPVLAYGVLVSFSLTGTAQGSAVTGLLGRYPSACVISIPLLGLPFLGAALTWLRLQAPINLTFSGFVAGVFAGSVGAGLYLLHCTDDSGLFVAVWYSLGLLLSGAIGALMGNRFLRW